MKNEFDIIKFYFNSRSLAIEDKTIIKAIGDDCAIIKPDSEKLLVLSTDTLIEAVHFPKKTSSIDIATKALAVNLSDLAAMGAQPAWFTLAISLSKQCDNKWLEGFSRQLHKMAEKYAIKLVGGDTTSGKILSITIQVHGYVDHPPMLRSNAKNNDIILVSGKLGGAALGLKLALKNNLKLDSPLTKKHRKQALKALNSPKPEIKKGLLIAPYANSAIDVSDGLLADLEHILEQSQCGAIIDVDTIPIAKCLNSVDKRKALLMALTGGDDYKLCVTLTEKAWWQLQQDCGGLEKTGFFPIGRICAKKGIRLIETKLTSGLNKRVKQINQLDGIKLANLSKGYIHFD